MARWLFDLGWLALIAFTGGTAGLLPELVGDPGKQLPREQHVALVLGLAIALPWLATRGAVRLGRQFPAALNVPNKDYWFAAERRERSFAWLLEHMFRFGLGLLVLLAAFHYEMLAAGRPDWPQPQPAVWLAGTAALATAFVVWIARLRSRFHAPPVEKPLPDDAVGARRWTRSDELVRREVQPLWALVWLTAPVLGLPLLASPGRAPAEAEVALAAVPVCWLLIVLVMGRFVVELHGDRLEWRYGWLGRPRWVLSLDDIARVEAVRSRPREGWGIRVTGQGMLYNAHGLDAVRIVRRDGRVLRIGTREPQRLVDALAARL